MADHRLTVHGGGGRYEISASSLSDKNILALLREAGIDEPEAPCGGRGICRKCAITVTGPVRSLDSGDIASMQGEEILACRCAPAGDLTIELADSSGMNVVTSGSADIAPGGSGLGLAVDIGTTTVAAYLYDLETGRQLASAGERNAQRAYGADVISRITACSEGRLGELRDDIRSQICGLAEKLCSEAGVSLSGIARTSIAGNTVMQHLFAGLSPIGIGVAPFTPESLFGEHSPASVIFPELAAAAGSDPDVYLCPCIAGYVGGDITAGLMASGASDEDGLCLYLDIGTNGEMAIGNSEGFISCATAAGPAFEGAEISCGMGGMAGAVDRVRVSDGDIEVHVIGGGEAEGVCGSGLIDAVAAMLELEVVTEAGRLLDADSVDEQLRPRMIRTGDGQNAFLLKDGVYISAADVREVQLAKAAIRAGAETLLQLQGRKWSEITALIIAGGFGSFIDKYSALRIGLLPPVDPSMIRSVGNAAGAGASATLTDSGLEAVVRAAEKCTYLELSGSREFSDNYLEYMAFYEE